MEAYGRGERRVNVAFCHVRLLLLPVLGSSF
jgi:hypothetical protein